MRFNLALACIAAVLCISRPASAQQVGPGYDIEMSRMIPVRDGTELEAWITKPSNSQAKLPTILTLTQYDIDGGRHGDSAGYYARRGYAFVQAYVRGRGQSGGVKSDSLGAQVGRDGHDLVEWIAAQPWSDGRVVMFGGSFVGMTQWQTAAQLPPHLAAIAPYVPIYPGWDVPNTNGIPQAWTAVILGYVAGRALNTGFMRNQDYWEGKMLEQYAAYRPFMNWIKPSASPPMTGGCSMRKDKRKSMFDVWLDHVGDAAFNLAAEPKAESYQRMNFPVLTVTGYYDDDQPGSLHYYRNYVAHAPAAAIAQLHLVIGPWDHPGLRNPPRRSKAYLRSRKPLSLTCRSCMPIGTTMHWAEARCRRCCTIECRLLHVGCRRMAICEDAGRGIVRQGIDRSIWPSRRNAAGCLPIRGSSPPSRMPTSRRPASSAILTSLPELEVAKYAADENLTSQFRAFQKRAITFHSDPFSQDTEIAGHMRLTLECAADAPDFDLWAQVLMVLADGSTVRLGEDIRRARFRDSQFKEELLKPGQLVQIPFEFNWLARRIPAGARLRLTIAPLNSPNYQKNFNTGGRMGYENIDDARIANIKIFHDARRASQLTLPLAAARGGPSA